MKITINGTHVWTEYTDNKYQPTEDHEEKTSIDFEDSDEYVDINILGIKGHIAVKKTDLKWLSIMVNK